MPAAAGFLVDEGTPAHGKSGSGAGRELPMASLLAIPLLCGPPMGGYTFSFGRRRGPRDEAHPIYNVPEALGSGGTRGYSPRGWTFNSSQGLGEKAAQGADLGGCLDLEKPGTRWAEPRPVTVMRAPALLPECTF